MSLDLSPEDRTTWCALLREYRERISTHACRSIIDGFRQLELDNHSYSIAKINQVLLRHTGWALTPVEGLLPRKDFFRLLSRKSYPFSVDMRKPTEADFATTPDLFHDLLGHLPLLFNGAYRAFLDEYSRVAIRYIGSAEVVKTFGRIFWFTAETGLVWEDDQPKVYGAAILTSRHELTHALAPETELRPFCLRDVVSEPYNHRSIQKIYYIMNSLDEFETMLSGLEPLAKEITAAGKCNLSVPQAASSPPFLST